MSEVNLIQRMDRLDRYSLFRLRLAEPTIKTYHKAIEEFLRWLPPNKSLTEWGELDYLVTDFINYNYKGYQGRRKHVAQDLRFGLEFYFPETLGLWLLTDRSIQGWKKVRPVTQKSVCPRDVAFGIAARLFKQGYPDTGIANLLTFDFYLRRSDIRYVRLSHVHIARLSGRLVAILMLPKTKTGLNQSVIIRPYFLIMLLKRLVHRRRLLEPTHPDPKLFSFSPATFARRFKNAASKLQLSSLTLTLHSLRYGGASQDFAERNLPYDEIRGRGRWNADESFRRYLQPGHLLAQLNKVPPLLRNRFRRLVKYPYRYFNVPPPVST